jgi:hypothetical protein
LPSEKIRVALLKNRGLNNTGSTPSLPPAGTAGEAHHAFLNGLVSLAEASVHAHLAATRNLSWGTEESRNKIAARLCELATELYVLTPDRQQIRRITAIECREGVFKRGGEDLFFPDGRETISGLAMTREAFERAIQQIAEESRP